MSTNLDEYLDLRTFATRHPQFKYHQLRWLVAQRRVNGLETAIKKVGRRLYFHVPSVMKWMAQKEPA